jgi:hypothetical protein
MHREHIAALAVVLSIVGSERMLLNNGMELLIPQDVARGEQLSLGSVVRV